MKKVFTTTGNITKVSDLYMFLFLRAVESTLILTVVQYFLVLFVFLYHYQDMGYRQILHALFEYENILFLYFL